MSRVQQLPGLWGALDRTIERTPAGGDGWDRLAAAVDPGEFRPRLAPGVELKLFKLRWGHDYLMAANPDHSMHYRLQPEDGDTIALMDGSRTVKEIVLERFKESGDLELSGVADLVRQLREGNFLDVAYLDVDAAVKRALDPASTSRRKARQFASTLSIEWKDADRLVRYLYDRGLKAFFGRWVTILCGVLAAFGVYAFVQAVESKRFTLTGQSVAIGFLVLLILDYFMVFIHELGHAVVLTRNGRKIQSAGFMIYFGSPAFFVDSSDGMMMGKGQEILASFAGPYAQLMVAAVSSIVAWQFPGWVLSETLYRYAVLNYWVVFMNLLPLLELDGYFILSDALEMPELRPKSLSFIQHDLWHKLRHRDRFTRQEIGLGLYGVLGIAFTIFSFYTAYFYWKTIFGGLISKLWNGGTIPRFILVALGLFIAGPLIRGAVAFARSVGKRFRLLWRRVRFRLEQKWRVEAAELIDKLSVFEDVPVETLNELAGRVSLRAYSIGQPVVRQGDRPTGFYVVRRGTLEVVEENAAGAERVLRVLARGESFGELALLEGSVRTATVRAVDEAEVFEIDKGAFDQLLADMIDAPAFAPSLQALAELQELPAFSHLSSADLDKLLEHGSWVSVAPGETIVEQGAVGDDFYAIGSGQVDAIEDGVIKRTLGPGAYFGEIALLMDVPRTATVRARTPVRVYRLDREGFDSLVVDAFRRGKLNPHVEVDQTWRH